MPDKLRFISDDFRISTEYCDTEWIMPYSHYHISCEIYILESGERNIVIDGKEYRTVAHDAALFYSNVPHKSSGETPYSGICIHFTEKYLDSYFTFNAKKQLMSCFNNYILHISVKDFDIIKSIADNFRVYDNDNFIKLATVLNILNRSDTEYQNAALPDTHKKQPKYKLILSYVNENYIYIKNIKELIELFHVSENYIFCIFRKYHNMTPKHYINKLRIQCACRKLITEHTSISSIAQICGFESYEYFLRVFKKVTGCTPTYYRKQNIKNT